MRHVNYDLTLSFDTPEDRWRSEQILLYMMTILTLRNFWFLLDNPDFPKLYDTGMIYMLPEQLERRPKKAQLAALNDFLSSTMGMGPSEIQHHMDLAKGVEIFRDIPRMMENGGGDCDNWASARAAEIAVAAYRLGGRANVKPYLVWHEDGDRMIYHAKVMHGDGSDEDPSIIQGMGGSSRATDRLEECRKNWERYDNMWQAAKRIMTDEDLQGDARVAQAEELKAAIDSFGFLPVSGVFRVGEPKPQSTLENVRKARGLDLLGSVRRVKAEAIGRDPYEHYIERCSCGDVISQCRCPSSNKTVRRVIPNGCARCRAKRGALLGRGGHRGGGIRQGWGFGGGLSIYPEWDLDITYDYDVASAAPAPTASMPGRRAA